MHQGRGENRSACNDRGARASIRPSSAGQESRDHGRGKRENLNWNLSRSESKNLPGFPNLAAGKQNRILIIRRHNADAASQEEARLDSIIADNVIGFLSTLQEIPRDIGTLGIQHITTKVDVQGRATALLSSLNDGCKKKLHRNDSVEGSTKGDSGSSFSCKISRGPALSLSLRWTGQQKQSRNQAFAVPPHNPPLAASRLNGSTFSLQEAGMFGKRRLWDSRTDVQQRQWNTGWWRRILFGGLACAAGIRLMSLKYPSLLLSELFSLPYFRRNGHQNSIAGVERRNWWRIPVKIASAISSRFCGSLSNSVVAAHFLLLIFELRNVIYSERLAESALKDHTEIGLRYCSCLSSCSQGCTCSEPSKLISRPAEKCHDKSSGELDQALVIDKLLLYRREDIAHMLVGLARKGRGVKGNMTSEEDIVRLAELIHAALAMPKHSLDKLLLSEPLVLPPAFEDKDSCAQADSQIFISFVSKEFPEGIELAFPRNTPNNEDQLCIAATATDPDFQSADTASAHFVVGDPRASQNSALLKSILLEKCKSSGSINSSKSSVYASDVESEHFFEACSVCLSDLEHSEYEELQMGPNSDSLERWKSTCSDVSSIHGDDDTLTDETRACHDSQDSSDLDALGDQSAEIQSAETPQTLHRADTGLNVTTAKSNEEMTPAVATCGLHHFADHPTCISLRKRRHEYSDQNYLTPNDLKTSRWRELVFWHGHCRQGNPSLYILLGKAVQQLPAAELQLISSVIISQMEYAELNFFRGSAKQMNIIIDLWGIGLMRMPPLEILSRVGMIMNRDYAGRGGSILLINAPVMLSMVIGAIKRVILRPGYNKGALIEKGFLEKQDQILFFNRNYKHALEKHFDLTMLPSMFGGKCNSKFSPEDCDHGVQFLERL